MLNARPGNVQVIRRRSAPGALDRQLSRYGLSVTAQAQLGERAGKMARRRVVSQERKHLAGSLSICKQPEPVGGLATLPTVHHSARPRLQLRQLFVGEGELKMLVAVELPCLGPRAVCQIELRCGAGLLIAHDQPPGLGSEAAVT